MGVMGGWGRLRVWGRKTKYTEIFERETLKFKENFGSLKLNLR